MINVTCAIIFKGNEILVAQRSEFMKVPLKWEFPGGKIEENESAENCLLREIKEELNIDIQIIERLKDFPYHYENFSINLIPFVSMYIGGEIKLLEHKTFKWLLKEDLSSLDWAEADIPVLQNFFKIKL